MFAKNRHRESLISSRIVLASFVILAMLQTQVLAEESTAHVDLRLLFERSWTAFFDEELPIEILQTRINQISDEKEIKDVRNWVWGFAQRGFRKDEHRYCLFRQENNSLREKFLGTVQDTRYRLTGDFIKGIYADFRTKPGQVVFDVFIEPSWISFSAKYADESTHNALMQTIDTPSIADYADRYFRLLYYGYKAYPERHTDFDADVRRKFLESEELTTAKIERLFQALNMGYWSDLEPKRKWMLTKTASRLFADFSPSTWADMKYQTVLALARILSKTKTTDEYKPVDIIKWLEKIGESIKQNPAQTKVRSLLVFFLRNSGIGLRESFQGLRQLFEADQRMFLALHSSPPSPSPMALWHQETRNLQDSTKMLCDFFKLDRADRWTTELWNCLRDVYYAKDMETKQRLFRDVITPIFKSNELAQNVVRRRLLYEAYNAGSFLLGSHRYEIAHYFLSNMAMNTTLEMAGDNREIIEYAINVYTDLEDEEPELYSSLVLKAFISQQGVGFPQTAEDRIIAYINCVIGEPLELICYALMGRSQLTKGVVFDWTDKRLGQLEFLLRKIVQLKGKLLHKYGSKIPQIKVLEEIAVEIIQEMKSAIEKKDKQQIVKMVRLSLKITVILEDDSYLERILVALRKDVFDISEDATSFQKFAASELDEKVRFFTVLHSEDLVSALKAVGKMKYILMFYRELYLPLRNIYGFFNKVGATPYIRFLDEFESVTYDKKADLEALFEEEIQALGAVHDERGQASYINAETAIVELIRAYCRKLNINAWKDLERFRLNRNFNLGALYRLLVEGVGSGTQDWELRHYDDQRRSQRYKEVALTFLDNMEDSKLWDRPVGTYEAPAEYSRWGFFSFLLSLVDLYEIYGFTFPEKRPTELYEGTPADGIRREILPIESKISVRKVDGSLRAKLFERYETLYSSNAQDGVNNWNIMIDSILLLPNQDENNKGNQEELRRYWELKKRAFQKTLELLDRADDSKERLPLLIWLCRLEVSVYGLSEKGHALGYENIRSKFLRRLSAHDLKSLIFEEFLLKQVNQSSKQESPPIVSLAKIVQTLVEALCRDYPLLGGKYDSLAQVILETYKKADPDTMLEELSPEHLKYLWFLTRKCGDALLNAASKPDNLSEEEKDAVTSIASSVFFVHSFFTPYVHGKFNINALLENDRRLFTFCLLDRRIKKPMVALMPIYKQVWSDAPFAWRFNMTPLQIKTFMICHNCLPVFLLEESLESPGLFIRLAKGEEISLVTYNFRLLWKREDKGRAALDNLCQEVLDGVDINKDIIAAGIRWSDRDYLDYFFGDTRSLLGIEAETSQIPRNFDTLVSKLAVLAFDPRYKRILAALEKGIAEAQDEEVRASLTTSLNSAKRFPRSIRSALADGYEYLGRILARQFSSPFTIQYACEKVWENVLSKRQQMKPEEATELYTSFYSSALFAEGVFKTDIQKRLIQTFYLPPQEEESFLAYHQRKHKEFEYIINGTTIKKSKTYKKGLEIMGLKNVMEKNQDFPFARTYEDAFIHILRAFFTGRHLEKGRPFIGDVVWAKDEKGQLELRALPYVDQQEHIHQLMEWVLTNGERYAEIPKLKHLFFARKSK